MDPLRDPTPAVSAAQPIEQQLDQFLWCWEHANFAPGLGPPLLLPPPLPLQVPAAATAAAAVAAAPDTTRHHEAAIPADGEEERRMRNRATQARFRERRKVREPLEVFRVNTQPTHPTPPSL